ncbi:hypothetical protein [Nonomuraea indica]|uniref:hypothetical protein n=1 Tax=Nonomuraea indica TaxID=1581193 RepID=UPI000C7973FB|nr:hypothetical protein [Nonomuraea indica]
MSESTPKTPVATTPPTPENVAEMLTSGDNDYHDGNYWHPSIGADGNVVHIGITAYSEDGGKLPEQHFRAVVVEGEQTPIVLERPEELGLCWDEDGGDLIAPTADGIRMWPPSMAWFDMTVQEARELAAHLAAMADEWEAAEAARAQKGGQP